METLLIVLLVAIAMVFVPAEVQATVRRVIVRIVAGVARGIADAVDAVDVPAVDVPAVQSPTFIDPETGRVVNVFELEDRFQSYKSDRYGEDLQLQKDLDEVLGKYEQFNDGLFNNLQAVDRRISRMQYSNHIEFSRLKGKIEALERRVKELE